MPRSTTRWPRLRPCSSSRLKQEQAEQPPASQAEAVPTHKPIWEVVGDLRKGIPPGFFTSAL